MIFFTAEEDLPEIRRRLRAIATHLKIPLYELRGVFVASTLDADVLASPGEFKCSRRQGLAIWITVEVRKKPAASRTLGEMTVSCLRSTMIPPSVTPKPVPAPPVDLDHKRIESPNFYVGALKVGCLSDLLTG